MPLALGVELGTRRTWTAKVAFLFHPEAEQAGLGLAVGFGILNGLWHEFRLFDEGDTGLSTPDTAEEADASQ